MYVHHHGGANNVACWHRVTNIFQRADTIGCFLAIVSGSFSAYYLMMTTWCSTRVQHRESLTLDALCVASHPGDLIDPMPEPTALDALPFLNAPFAFSRSPCRWSLMWTLPQLLLPTTTAAPPMTATAPPMTTAAPPSGVSAVKARAGRSTS